jgi:hypothetical protein
MSEEAPFFEALAKVLGIEPPASKDMAFSRDGKGFLLSWQENSKSFLIYAEIGNLAGWRDGEVCRQLLAANFLLAETEGATLSLNVQDGSIGLNYILPAYGLETESFIRVVDNLARLSELWADRLLKMCKEQEDAVAAAQGRILAGESAVEEAIPPAMALRV